jgi:hypothetical protein
MMTTARWSIVFVLGALFAVTRVARLQRQPGWTGLVIAIVVAGSSLASGSPPHCDCSELAL